MFFEEFDSTFLNAILALIFGCVAAHLIGGHLGVNLGPIITLVLAGIVGSYNADIKREVEEQREREDFVKKKVVRNKSKDPHLGEEHEMNKVKVKLELLTVALAFATANLGYSLLKGFTFAEVLGVVIFYITFGVGAYLISEA